MLRSHALPKIAPHFLRVAELRLTHFRNYTSALLENLQPLNVLTGANGSGKTNILEALSLLTPGRGMRRARADEWSNTTGPGTWSVAAQLLIDDDEVRIGTGRTLAAGDADDETSRDIRINGASARRARALADHVTALWLTPEHDGLFRGPAGERRRFLDRLVAALDSSHNGRVTRMEKLLRSRNRLLAEDKLDDRWLLAIEHELAMSAVAVSAARLAHVASLSASINAHHDKASPFPFAVIELQGEMEDMLKDTPGTVAEDRYRENLARARYSDAQAGRTTRGAHLCDLSVQHGPKQIAAAGASTGEQKALLVGLILAQARHAFEQSGRMPLLLLDEIAAHFDALRRAALYDALEHLGAQAFMTGTDPEMFTTLRRRAGFIEVMNGQIQTA